MLCYVIVHIKLFLLDSTIHKTGDLQKNVTVSLERFKCIFTMLAV